MRGERPAQADGNRPDARQAYFDRRCQKKTLKPAKQRELVGWIRERYRVSMQRAHNLSQFSRAAWYRASRARDQMALRYRIREITASRPLAARLSSGEAYATTSNGSTILGAGLSESVGV